MSDKVAAANGVEQLVSTCGQKLGLNDVDVKSPDMSRCKTFDMVLSEIRPRVAKGVLPKISVRTILRLLNLDFGGVHPLKRMMTQDHAKIIYNQASARSKESSLVWDVSVVASGTRTNDPRHFACYRNRFNWVLESAPRRTPALSTSLMVVLLPGSQRSSGGKRKRQATLMSRSKRAMKDGTKGHPCKCNDILEVPSPLKGIWIC